MFNQNITKELFNRFVYCNYLLELQKYDKFLENEKLSFENAKKLLEKCVEELKNKKLIRKIDFEYLGFTDTVTTSYLVNLISIKNPNIASDLIFSQEIKNEESLKRFLSSIFSIDKYPDFFYISSELETQLRNFKVNMLEYKPIDIKDIKEEFLEEYTETDYGFLKNNFSPVGHSYTAYVCDIKMVYNNLSLITWYIRKFYESLLGTKDESKVLRSVPNIIDNLPIITTTDELLSSTIAYANKTTKLEILNSDIEDKYNLILSAISKNPNCYNYLPYNYQKDVNICKAAINASIKVFPSIVENGPLSENEWKVIIMDNLN